MPTLSLSERIASNIRAEAARRGERQADIAMALGLSQQTVSTKFRGKVPFTWRELEALAEHYGVPVESLFASSGSTVSEPTAVAS